MGKTHIREFPFFFSAGFSMRTVLGVRAVLSGAAFLCLFLMSFSLSLKADAVFSDKTNLGTGLYYGSMVLGDIDNDGDLDLIASGNNIALGRRLDLYRNDGAGNFSCRTNFGPPVYDSSLALGDIDSDGDLDLIVSGIGTNGNRLDMYLNPGNGDFTNPIPFGIPAGGSYLTLGDLTGDGSLDLVVSGGNAGYMLERYFNRGDGVFLTNVSVGTGVYWSTLCLGDIDGDDDADLVVTGQDQNLKRRLDIYKNNGTGVFSRSTNSAVGVVQGAMVLGDIDNDGDLDFIVTGHDGTAKRLDRYLNDGTGRFTGPLPFGTAVHMSSMALADLDADGDLDLVIAGWPASGRRLDRYMNNGDGTFTGPAAFGEAVEGACVVLGDIDGDRDPDLIVNGYGASGENLERYRNLIGNNAVPSTPSGCRSTNEAGYWTFLWDAGADDHTPASLMRYRIALGNTSSGQYGISGLCHDFPRGQANFGNVQAMNRTFYRSGIPATTKVYWRISALDTGMAASAYSPEQVAVLSVSEATQGKGVPEGVSEAVLAPNPFRRSSSAGKMSVVFYNIPAECGIRIFTVTGREVASLTARTGTGRFEWAVMDGKARPLKPGRYFCLLTDGRGGKKVLGLVVVP